MTLSRRVFLQGSVIVGSGLGGSRRANAQTQSDVAPETRLIQTPVLTIGYEERGGRENFPVILLHGFPDDVHAWDEVAPALVRAGYRTLTPYSRGFGPTRFRDAGAPRMAEQAAIAQDVIDFADALHLRRFALVGFDWGGRAACIVAALHPERVRAAVLIGGYTIQNTITPSPPGDPAAERALWYQWYFNTERGRAGLQQNRRALCRLLWETWSPGWRFSDETFNRTAAAFENPDFVDLVIHSYRHRNYNAPGEDRFKAMEQELARSPKIEVPSIVLHGADDGVRHPPVDSPAERALFTKLAARDVVAGAGHFMPREKPEVVAAATLKLLETNG